MKQIIAIFKSIIIGALSLIGLIAVIIAAYYIAIFLAILGVVAFAGVLALMIGMGCYEHFITKKKK